MNFDFSDDQKALRNQSRRFLESACSMQRLRRILDNNEATYDRELWKSIAEQGWLGACIREEHGGLGLSHLELCVLSEELGRVLAPIPFASTLYLFAEALMLAGSEDQKLSYLPRIARGDLIGAVAGDDWIGSTTPLAQNRRTGFDNVGVTAQDCRLNGIKSAVIDGGIADAGIVLAIEQDLLSLFIVNLNAKGVARKNVRTLDPTRDCAQWQFGDVLAERLGSPGQGSKILETVFDKAAVLIAFEQLGGADRCLEMAGLYAADRYAFGKPIGSFQAIKHKLVDVFVKNELARGNCYFGAWALNTNAIQLPIAASAARVAASDAFWHASKENIQTHGGIGYTWESDCHLFYRRACQLSTSIASPEIWKERLVSHLEYQAAE